MSLRLYQITRHCILWQIFSFSLVVLFTQALDIATDREFDVCGARCLAFCSDEIDQDICDRCRQVEGQHSAQGSSNCYTEPCTCYLDSLLGESSDSFDSIESTTRDVDDSTEAPAPSIWNTIAGLSTVHPPSLVWVTNVTTSFIRLEWTHNPPPMLRDQRATVIYLVLINETASDSSLSTYLHINLTNESRLKFEYVDTCMLYTAQVTTVTWWQVAVSDTFNITVGAGKVPSLAFYNGIGPVFRERSDEILTRIIATTPYGWLPGQIDSYEWIQWTSGAVRIDYHEHVNCPAIRFKDVHDNLATMRMHKNGFGCRYIIAVRAITSCRVYGNWSKFVFTFNDCDIVKGFPCPPKTVEQPGAVEDVYLAFIPNMQLLWVQWEAPRELGSAAVIQRYVVRHGICMRSDILNTILPHGDVSIPSHMGPNPYCIILPIDNVSIASNEPYGVQILALGPGANSSDEFNRLEAHCTETPYQYTITQRSNNINNKDHVILYDEDGLKIYKDMNTTDMDVIVCRNDTINDVTQTPNDDRYMLQWGDVDDMERSSSQTVKLQWDGERSILKSPNAK